MALVLKDRVRETSFTIGTGTITLSGAIAGFQSFSVIGNSNTTYYVIADSITGQWEVGIGTYTASGTTLSRDTILESSDGGTAIDFAGNPKDVFCTYPAERSVYVDGSSIVPATASRLGFANLTQGSALSVLGVTGDSPADVASIAAGVDNQVLCRSGTALAFGAVNLGSTDAVTGTLPVGNGGSGAATLTGVLKGNGTSAFTAGNVNLASEVTGTLPVANGGTGITSFGTGVATALGQNVTGSGGIALDTSPIFTTPNIGAATGTQLDIDNIRLDGNTISTTNTNGNLTTTANGTGYYIYSGTQAVLVPKGNNTTERPGTPVTGMLRYNTTSDEFEGYSGSSPAWKSVGGAAITNDTTTASDLYPAYLNATSGTAATVFTSNAQYLFKPSTGELKVKAPVAQNGILVNATTMTSNYTIATGTNGLSVGPFTINSGVTLTIDSGQRHLIL